MTDLPVLPPWSKSSLDEILHGCAWRWKLKKIDKLEDPGTPATAMGTAYHAAIEQHERNRIVWRLSAGAAGDQHGVHRAELMRVGSYALDNEWDMLDPGVIERYDQSLAETRRQLQAALDNWWYHGLRDRLMELVPVAREPYFRVPYGDDGSRLHGYIDEVTYDLEDETWVVIDDKTAKNWRYWPEGGDGHEIEGTVYVSGSQLARNLPTFDPIRMEWHIARKKASDHPRFQPTRIVTIDLQDWHFDGLDMDVEEANRMVRDRDFPKNPDSFLCAPKWCPFHIDAGGPCDPHVDELP